MFSYLNKKKRNKINTKTNKKIVSHNPQNTTNCTTAEFISFSFQTWRAFFFMRFYIPCPNTYTCMSVYVCNCFNFHNTTLVANKGNICIVGVHHRHPVVFATRRTHTHTLTHTLCSFCCFNYEFMLICIHISGMDTTCSCFSRSPGNLKTFTFASKMWMGNVSVWQSVPQNEENEIKKLVLEHVLHWTLKQPKK